MTRTWAFISVAALLVAGMSVGALAMHLYHEREATRMRDPFTGPPPRFPIRHLEERLELTPEQWRKIGEIRRESWRESEELRRELRPRIEKQMEATREKILAVLTPEQRKLLDVLRRDHPGAFHRFLLGEGRPGRHRPPGLRPGGPPPPPEQPDSPNSPHSEEEE